MYPSWPLPIVWPFGVWTSPLTLLSVVWLCRVLLVPAIEPRTVHALVISLLSLLPWSGHSRRPVRLAALAVADGVVVHLPSQSSSQRYPPLRVVAPVFPSFMISSLSSVLPLS